MPNNPSSWPDGKRVAVLVTVLLESWGENKSPTYFTRTTPLKPGAIDHAGIQWSQYGAKEGIWRILRVLDACGVHATVLANAKSAELHPDAIRQIIRSGHELGAHAYSQDQYLLNMSVEEQRDCIHRSLDILETVSGKRPEGWGTPLYSWSPDTVDLLVQEGMRWHADALDTSLPYRQKTRSGTIVALPHSEFLDNRVLRASPRDFYDVYKDTFDYLYAQEPMGLLHIGLHCHFGGRPLIAAMLYKILRYLKEFPDLWFPSHSELVQWFLAQDVDDLSYARRFFG